MCFLKYFLFKLGHAQGDNQVLSLDYLPFILIAVRHLSSRGVPKTAQQTVSFLRKSKEDHPVHTRSSDTSEKVVFFQNA